MNAYKPKFQKKLMISPKNTSQDLSFKGFNQGSKVITPQADKIQSTRHSFALDQKNKDTFVQGHLYNSNNNSNPINELNRSGQQNQQGYQQQHSQVNQQISLQQSQNKLHQQHQQQLLMMIQQQQGVQTQQSASKQPQSGQSSSQYSNVLNLLLQQQNQQQQQSLYNQQNISSSQYSSAQQQPLQIQQNQSYTNRQNSNANYLYQQLNPPQSTKAADSNRRQNNPFSGTYSAKNTSAPQSILKDFLTKMNKDQPQQQQQQQQQQLIQQVNQQVQKQSNTMMNSSSNNSNSNVLIINSGNSVTNNHVINGNIYTSNYTNTNPDLSNIYNPNNFSGMNINQQPSSTKSNRIHSHYFPSTCKNKNNRNQSLDKLNDSSFLRLKNVQSPKQRTIRTIMPGSNRDNSVGNSSSNRNGYHQRDQSESGIHDNQFILPNNILQQKPKRSGNSLTGPNSNGMIHNNNSYSKIQQNGQQNFMRPNGTPFIKKDLTIKTGNSIETLKDILSPTNNNNPKTTTATNDSKKHLNSNTLPIQSYTTTHAAQVHQQKRLIQKREEIYKNKQNTINSSFQYIMPTNNNESSVDSGNRFSYNVINNVTGNQAQKMLKNKNNSLENQQFKNLSFTQPLVDQFKLSKENNNTQNSNTKLTVKQYQQKQQLQFIQKALQQQVSQKQPQNQGSIQTSEGNDNRSDTNYESQGQNLDNLDQHKIDLSTASQTPFRNGNSTNEKKATLDESNTRNTERDEKKEEQLDWQSVKIPITPLEALAKYQRYLTSQEKSEILEYKRIYFIGHNAKKQIDTVQTNNGHDDNKGEYQINVNDHIAYRYEIKDFLGKGSFGQVLKVFDHKRKEFVALKVIRNKQKFHEQALIELNILHYIKEKDYENQTNIVKIRDFVIFRNHVCLVFELLSINLYDLLRNNKFQGLSLELIRRFAIQLLNAINFLKENRIIHCDLKPENILLKQSNKSGIKIADFGSSCFDDQVMYTYIQSRYYRSPEVILGIPYGSEIDMWSFGCIIAELFLGYPIFPGEDENEQMLYIMELIGVPDSEFLKKCSRKKYFFDQNDQALQIPNSRGKIRIPNSKNWKSVIGCTDDNFIDFVKNCLVWEPSQRMTPRDALLHPWILEGLPEDIRVQHIKFLRDKAFETPSEKEFHKQSCLQAQANADAQSTAMAIALQKIYKYNNKKRIQEKKSTTQGTVSEETRNSVVN